MSQNGTGIQYPEITLGGVTYVVRFTRGALLYRVAKRGLTIADVYSTDGNKRLAAVFDLLHAMLGDYFLGTVEDLSEALVTEEKVAEATVAVISALGKV